MGKYLYFRGQRVKLLPFSEWLPKDGESEAFPKGPEVPASTLLPWVFRPRYSGLVRADRNWVFAVTCCRNTEDKMTPVAVEASGAGVTQASRGFRVRSPCRR